ncbi:hypothetical protein [Pseudaminobacter sp. NGMCC 1.201702]|uniref:hypothetical protein n=1 Tax=Pseudaminobacter sp. NGMCC 1.201702 TaxID=3391825 RepID=UPI0039EF3A5D
MVLHSEPADQGANKQAAQVRGNIQKGCSGDKVPGFDPAAAPLETDAEAAGTPEPKPRDEKPSVDPLNAFRPHPNSSSQDTAMRSFEENRESTLPRIWFVGIALLLVIALAAAVFILPS